MKDSFERSKDKSPCGARFKHASTLMSSLFVILVSLPHFPVSTFMLDQTAITTPSTCSRLSFNETQLYLDVLHSPTATCHDCPANQTADLNGIGCKCKSGYYKSSSSCSVCATGLVSSADRSFCYACPFQVGGFVESPLASCTSSCPSGYYIQERSSSGAPLATAVCAQCLIGSYPSPDLTQCISCPDANMYSSYLLGEYSCICPVSMGFASLPQNGTCVNSNTLNSLTSAYPTTPFAVTYRSILARSGLTSLSITSDFLSNSFYASYAQCADNQVATACQLLANLCVLQLYDQSTAVCAAYQKLYSSSSSSYLPALYYGTSLGQDAIAVSHVVPNSTFDLQASSGLNRLSLVFGIFTMNGTFLGYQNVTHQLSICSLDMGVFNQWSFVGNNFEFDCTVNLVNINAGNDGYMYDPYFLDQTGSLISIPVRIMNYIAPNGVAVNAGAGPSVSGGQSLFRRFFLLDKVSSVSSGKQMVVRVATSITFNVVWAQVDGKIYIPVLDVQYSERTMSSLSATDISSMSSPMFSFRAIYFMDLTNFWLNVKIFFSIITVVGGIFGLFYGRNWSIRNSKLTEIIDLRFFVITGTILAGTTIQWIFWLIFGICMYWLVFFKGQRALNLFLPFLSLDIYSFTAALIAILVCNGFNIVRVIWMQCNSDIFFIDWEKPKAKASHLPPVGDKSTRQAVSIWRSIFMANQWSQLQTYRRVSMEFILLGVLFFMEGLGWRYAASWRPNINNLSPGAVNPVLLFAMDALIWIMVIAIALVYNNAIQDRFFRNKIYQYIDILSVSNISMIVFDELHHGYYVHGCTVHPYADTNMQELNANLRKEQHNMLPRRGLQGTQCVGFEFIASKQLRDTFDKLYKIVVEGEYGRGSAASSAKARLLTRNMQAVPDLHIEAYNVINKFLMSFIDRSVKEYIYSIREKKVFARLVEIKPYNSKGTVFFKDETAFLKTLLSGVEYQLWLEYIVIFYLIDYGTSQPSIAAACIFGIDLIVRCARHYFGQHNIGRKTLLDWKFLI